MSDLPAKLQKIDPAKFKLAELAEVERQIGRKLAGEMQTGELGMDTMAGLLWIELRRHDPQATFEQAGDYDLETLMGLFADDDEPADDAVDPTASLPSSAANGSSSNGEPTLKPMLPSTTSGG
jgi:hypothetical protein